MSTLGPQTITKIRSYIDDGVPLEDLGMTRDQIERVRVAERLYERLQQDPWLDRRRYLIRTEGRTRQQAILDMEVVDIFMQSLNTISRQLVEHRRDVTLQRLARGAEQTGDLKLQERVLTHIEKQLADMGDEKDDAVKNTAALPAVLVGVEVVDDSKMSLDDRSFRALLEKYHGKPDIIDAMIAERREALLLASGSLAEVEDVMYQEMPSSLPAWSEDGGVTTPSTSTTVPGGLPPESQDDIHLAANQFMDNDYE